MRATPGSGEDRRTLANKNVLQMQRIVLRILLHVHQLNYCQDQAKIGKTYDIVANFNNYQHPEAVERFMIAYHRGFLPSCQPSPSRCKQYRDDGRPFFILFCFVKDYDTFYKIVCLVCDNVNEGQFNSAFGLAVFHYQGMNNISLPPIYAVYLYLFVKQEVNQKAYEIHQKEAQVTTQKTYVFSSNYIVQNPEELLLYFTEIAGLNAFHSCCYFNHPTSMKETYYDMQHDRYGVQLYYTIQPLYAFRYLECLSNEFIDLPAFNYYQLLQTLYNPKLCYNNGQEVQVCGTGAFFQYCYPRIYGNSNYPMDGNNYVPNLCYGNYYMKNVHTVNVFAGTYNAQYGEYVYFSPEEVKTYKKCIRDAIDVYTHVYKNLTLYDNCMKGIGYLGGIIEGNNDSAFKRYYGSLHHYCCIITGQAVDTNDQYGVVPFVLKKNYTAMRVLVNQLIYKRAIFFFQKYNNYLPKYSYNKLAFQGVKVEKIEVSRLITFFDYFEIDLESVLYAKDEEVLIISGLLHSSIASELQAFCINIQVNSVKAQDIMMRAYLGPKYDYLGHEYDINENYFVEIGHLEYYVQTGPKFFEPNSGNFNVLASEHHSYRITFRKVNEAVEEKGHYQIDKDVHYYGYLKYLSTKKEGQSFAVYVIVTPYHKQEDAGFQPYDFKNFCY